jgi:hypothetical protein
MKNNIYKVMLILVIFCLTACQAQATAPANSPASEFFKDVAGQWITVKPPAGWVAKPGAAVSSPSVIVTDDWLGYLKTNPEAVGIIILPLTEKGSAEQVLQTSVKRFEGLLAEQVGEVLLEQAAGQSYAWVEYQGKSIEENDTDAYYFLAVIATDQRSVFVFSSVDMDQKERIRPAYQSTVKGITLH